jgi:hypothetical protein
MKVGWVVKMVLVAALALLSFLFWNSWLVSVGFTAVLLYLIHRQGWLRAAYVYVAGLVYGFATTGLGLAMAVALASALLWPLAVGFWYVTDGTLELPQAEPLVVPTIERLDEVDEEQFVTAVPVEAPVVQTPEPELPTGPLQIRVQGNSRVRAEPNTTSAILAVVTDGEVYVVLAANEDNTWYKIQLASGAEGWIGSSRVIEITP